METVDLQKGIQLEENPLMAQGMPPVAAASDGWTTTASRTVAVKKAPASAGSAAKQVSVSMEPDQDEEEFEGSGESEDDDEDDAERQRRLELARKDARAILESADVISSKIKASKDKRRVPDLPLDFGGDEKLSLRDHQVEGLIWLYSSRALHINGILADEQGLGKTCQTIALLAAVKHASEQASAWCKEQANQKQVLASRDLSTSSPDAGPTSASVSHQHSTKRIESLMPFVMEIGDRPEPWRPPGLEEEKRLAAAVSELHTAPPGGREQEAAAVRKQLFGSITDALGGVQLEQMVDQDMARSGTHLVIVPTSTLGNWSKEFNRWAPSLEVALYRGSKAIKQRFVSGLRRGSLPDVVLTTYSQLEDDQTFKSLQAKVGSFDYMVLDEAHGLKNAATRRYRRIAGVRSRQRLLLTGTPIQNNLVEVLTLLQFTLADLVRLSSGAMFQSRGGDDDDDDGGVATQAKQAASEWSLLNEAFVIELAAKKKVEDAGDAGGLPAASGAGASGIVRGASVASIAMESGGASAGGIKRPARASKGGAAASKESDAVSVVESIRKTLSPFILRRTKKMVLSTLPAKVLKSVVLKGTPVQRRMYEITRALAARSRMLTEGGVDCFAAATQTDEYAKRDILTDPLFVAGITASIPGLVDAESHPLGKSGGVSLRDFRGQCGLGQERGGAGFGPAGMSMVMTLRKAANHPMLARALFPDWACLTIARLLRFQELVQSTRSGPAKKILMEGSPFEAVPAFSTWPEVVQAMHKQTMLQVGGLTKVQAQSSSSSASGAPEPGAAGGGGGGEVSATAASKSSFEIAAALSRPRRSAAAAAKGSMNEDAMFKRQEELLRAAAAMEDDPVDDGPSPLKRSRTSTVPAADTARQPEEAAKGRHPLCPGMPPAATLGVPFDMIPHIAPRYRYVSQTLPAPSTAKELLVWARGDKRLANIAEEVLCYCDYDLHQICESDPRLQDIAAMTRPYLLLSGKAGFLRRAVKTLGQRKEKLLVFSQFTSMLSIYEDVLDHMGVGHLRLDGSTKGADRQRLIDRFTVDDSIRVFLLSTKAGGVGLNLTAASCLIINDLDWNPHNDAQAEDRCHRIGQTKQVHVFRLSMAETIEQRMDEVAQDKQRLKRALLSDEPGDKGAKEAEAEMDKESLLRAELGL